MIHLIFISKKNINDIVRIVIVESPEKSGLLTDGATEKHEIKKQEDRFLGATIAPVDASLIATVASSLIQPVVSSLITDINYY